MAKPDRPRNRADVQRAGSAILTDHLPEGWVTRVCQATPAGRGKPDFALEVVAPNGEVVTLLFEVKTSLESRHVPDLAERLTAVQEAVPGSKGGVMAPYLASPVRKRLTEAGLTYVDVTGNLRVVSARPGLFISDRGADHDPWRGPGRPRATLKGAPAARMVRTLVDISGRWTVRELTETAMVSTGAAYRVVNYLDREGLIDRQPGGEVVVPDWAELLRRWSGDYSFTGNTRVSRWIAPRGLPDLLSRCASSGARYAVTGTIAAAQWAAYAPARSAMIYVSDATKAADAWGLRPAEAGANTILGEPEVDVVFARTKNDARGLTVAAPAQVVVDLMTGPGRNPSEAEELLQWMRANESFWRD